MNINRSVYEKLEAIVGCEYISNRPEELYIYSQFPSGRVTGKPDILVLPGTTDEICSIVRLACENKIPIVPMGGGLSLSDLTTPRYGGLLLDMKRMDNIVEVNAKNRHIIFEAGATIGKIIGHLKKYHPDLRISIPDAPPSATMCGNTVIYGTGHLSVYGSHAEMIQGLEVVLSNGEMLRFGCNSSAAAWAGGHYNPGLPDLFMNWLGGTGIITKVYLKLYPKHKFRDVLIFKIENPDRIPLAIQKATASGISEDVLIFAMKQLESRIPMTLLQIFITGDRELEITLKTELLTEQFKDCQEENAGFRPIDKGLLPEKFINDILSEPKLGIEGSVDALRGGGSAYVGADLPIEVLPEVYRKGLEISEKYGFTGPLYTIRTVGRGHHVIFTFMYPFNRDDPDSIKTMEKASDEASDMILHQKGIIWKPSIESQKKMLKSMDAGMKTLVTKIKHSLDPGNVFNPGNWEIEKN